jgi:hypothetical protein
MPRNTARATRLPEPTADQIRAAKEWILECTWQDVEDAADLDEYSAAQIQRGVDRSYDGGWSQFVTDSTDWI